MPRRYLIIGLLVLLVGAAVVAGVWIPQRQGPDWRTLLEQKYGRKVVQLDRESFNRPHLGPDSSLVRAAWVEWEGGGTDLIGLPAHELGEPAEVVRRAELLPEAEWRLWCFQAFHPGEADPWQTSAAGFALHSGFVRSPHLGDTIV
ncbi:MAG TPA: hypothetical protein VNT75_21775, partial [Symbiobacteriaceae bacterium]|nr:hypothetical protein [Symbiobacteriaceae bacterium]